MAKSKSHSSRKHAKHSPSRLKSLEICPHHKPLKSTEVHEVTASGTRCHEAFETGDMSDLDDVEVQLTNWCIAYRDHVLGQGKWHLHHEAKLETYEKTCWGYGDLLAVSEDLTTAHYLDPKFGYNKQADAESNPQGQAYTIGAFRAFPDLKHVTVHFLYPRFGEVSVAEYTRDDLDRLRLRNSGIVERAKAAERQTRTQKVKPGEEEIPFNPQYKNCLYCGNKAACKAMWSLALDVTETSDFELPTILHPEEIVSVDDMGKALDIANQIEEWAKGVKTWVRSNALEMDLLPEGYEWKPSTSRSKTTNPVGLVQMAKTYAIPEELILEASDVSLAQLCKAAGKVAPRGEKGATEDAFREEAFRKGFAARGQKNEHGSLKRIS